jgi:hypothetical protein
MPYVQRNAQGRIVAVAAQETALAAEWLAEDAAELVAFVCEIAPQNACGAQAAPGEQSTVQALTASDLALIRVVEDVIDLLIDQSMMRFTDLPVAVQEKLMQRRSLRQGMNSLRLMGEGNDVI